MMWNRRLGLLVCVSAALLCTACGGGGGDDGGPSADLGGWWDVEGRPPGGTKPYEPFTIIQAAHTGSSFWANGTEFTQSGSQLVSYDPSASDEDREVILLTILSADLLEGTVEVYERDILTETQEIRVRRRTTAPTGIFTMTDSLAVSSSTAYCAVDDGAAEFEFGVYHVVPYEREAYVQVKSYDQALAVGTYTVGGAPGEVEADVGVAEDGGDATSGTVTFTAVGTTVVGTYDLTYLGGHVEGTFNAEVLLDRLP